MNNISTNTPIFTNLQKAVQAFILNLSAIEGLAKNTSESYLSDINDFINFLQYKKIKFDEIEDINKENLELYFQNLQNIQMDRSTIQRRYSSLNKFCIFLKNNDYTTSNPMLNIERLKTKRKIPDFVTNEEIEELIRYYQNKPKIKDIIRMRNILIIEMLYSTGMRVSELCNIKTKEIRHIINHNQNQDDIFFILICGKGNKERYVPVRKKVIILLKEYLDYKKLLLKKKNTITSEYLFEGKKKNPITRRMIGFIIKEAAISSALNWKKISPHTLRHSFATDLLNRGMDLIEIQELLGHQSINTVEIYTHIKKDEILKIMEND